MKLIIPMSGLGQRFVDAGYTEPKPLIMVRGKPIIQHVIEMFLSEASEASVDSIHCICNEEHLANANTNMRQLLEGLPYNCIIHSIPQHKLGPVYAVSQIFDSIDDEEEVIVSYCDYGSDFDFNNFLEMREGYDGVVFAYKGFHPHMLFKDNYAFLRMENGLVEQVREKEPFTDNPMNEYASNGAYYFRKGSFVKEFFTKAMEKGYSKNGEYYVSLVYNAMIEEGKKIGVFEIDRMLQWGTPRDLEIYKMWDSHFAKAKKECSSCATLVLPMAGKGSRFKMVGYEDPKPLLDVKGDSMIVRAVEALPSCNKNNFICLQEHLDAYPIRKVLESRFTNPTVFTIPDVTEGQACTTMIGLQNVSDSEPILVSACDNGVDFDEEAYMKLEADSSIDVIVWSFNNNPTSKLYPHMYAWLDVDSEMNVKKVSVKKYFAGAEHAIIGTMFFRTAALFKEGFQEIVEKNIRTNGEFYVDDLLNPLIEKGYKVKCFPVEAYICWGTPNDYQTYCYWDKHFSQKNK
jgi:NDP-sugar pyrophosphorylase family protein